jgi:hypothetical protein
MNYNNKQLIGAMIVAGWDEAEGGQVSDKPSSTLLKPHQQLTDLPSMAPAAGCQ